MSASLQEIGVETKFLWGSTLFHLEDLPFKLEDMPSNYGGFREKVQSVAVRDTIEAPQQLKGLPASGNVKPGDIPSFKDLGLNARADLRQVHAPSEHFKYMLQADVHLFWLPSFCKFYLSADDKITKVLFVWNLHNFAIECSTDIIICNPNPCYMIDDYIAQCRACSRAVMLLCLVSCVCVAGESNSRRS